VAAYAAPLTAAAPVPFAVAQLDRYLEFFREAVTPAVAALFEDVRRDLGTSALPFPERVRARLRPFFDGTRVAGTPLSPAIIARARYTVDAAAARRLLALTPASVAAITVGDIVAFAPREYQPDCIEGVALIAHELVHVAQFAALGRDRFLERYVLAEALRRQLGTGSGADSTDADNELETAAYCRQAEVCRTLARAGSLPPCHGRDAAVCPICRRQPR
jgi:hypothetical protein